MKTREVFDVYFPALMVFAVFTFASELLKKLVFSFSYETLLLTILWVALIIQITFAYTRGLKHREINNPKSSVIASGLEILCVIYMCSIMGGYRDSAVPSYLHLTIPFLGVAVSQLLWFKSMRRFDVSAFFRLFILFVGTLLISISEAILHCIWNLVAIDALLLLLGILRYVDNAPRKFCDVVIKLRALKKSRNRQSNRQSSIPT